MCRRVAALGGGKGRDMRQGAAGDAERMREGQRVGNPRARERAQGRLVHQSAQCERGEQEAPGFLTHKVRGLAVEHALGAPQMRLQFIERGLDFPAFVIELRQLAASARAGSRSVVTSR